MQQQEPCKQAGGFFEDAAKQVSASVFATHLLVSSVRPQEGLRCMYRVATLAHVASLA